MKKMKHIAGSLAFLSGLFAILLVLSAVMMPRYEGYNFIEVEKKLDALTKEKEDTIDVIIVGDSETYSAYSPLHIWKEHGITSYICGTHAQRLCDTMSVLTSVFESQSPKVVVLEANSLFRTASLDPSSDDATRSALEKIFPILKYHNGWKQMINLVDVSEQNKMERESIRKGFKLRNGIQAYKGGEWMLESDKRAKFGELVEGYLEDIYALCKENGTELVLISTPAPKNWTYAKHNAVSDWAATKEVTYLDMNLVHKDIQIDWAKDTRDGGDHLNYDGAKKVTAYFGKYLKNNFELTDHREDVEYSSWDEDVKNSGMYF